MGHSAGGQLALCLAAHEADVKNVVSLAGVVDLQRAYKLHLSNDAVVEFLHGTPTEFQSIIGKLTRWSFLYPGRSSG